MELMYKKYYAQYGLKTVAGIYYFDVCLEGAKPKQMEVADIWILSWHGVRNSRWSDI